MSTAIYTNAAYADKLLSVELMFGSHAHENVLCVARIFAAISKCMVGLELLYNDLPESTEGNPSIEFPSPTPYPSTPTPDPSDTTPTPTSDSSTSGPNLSPDSSDSAPTPTSDSLGFTPNPTPDPSHSPPTPTLDSSGSVSNPPSLTPNRLSPSEEIDALKFFCKLDRVHATELVTVDEENERHMIYLAKRSIGSAEETVLVKFTPEYHEAAHRLLASQKPPLAPALHSCTRVIGDLYMVVMEYLEDAKSLHAFLPPFPPGPRPPRLNVEVVNQQLVEALELLHGENLVFGDLREANILYLPKDGGRAFLVDFDRVGEHGKDRYSCCLNPAAKLGVSRWQIMEKPHDLLNLKKLISRLQVRAVGGKRTK